MTDKRPYPPGHERESCGCDYCQHPDWCGSDDHDGEVHDGAQQAPLWPCSTVLAATGDADAEAFFERESAEWLAWAEAQHPEWFRDSCLLSWCARSAVGESKFCAEHAITWGASVLPAPSQKGSS